MNNRRWIKDWSFVGFGSAVLIASCLWKSRAAPMWMDEVISALLIRDQSLHHAISALADQVDGVPPLYYIVARAWAFLFSSGVLSLRLFSSCCFCVAFTLLWFLLRRRYAFFPAAVALAFGIGSNSLIAFENANVRFYGLLFALIVLALFVSDTLRHQQKPSMGWLVANAFIQAALVLSHPFGLVYSFVIFGAGWICDLLLHRINRFPVMMSYLAGWLCLLLWSRQMLHQAALNSPLSWIPVPSLTDLRMSVNADIDFYPLILLFPFVWVLGFLLPKPDDRSAARPADRVQDDRTKILLVSGVALVCIIPAVWALSRLTPSHSLFLSRYFIGATAGWAIILAELTTIGLRTIRAASFRWFSLPLAATVLVGFAPLFHGPKEYSSPRSAAGLNDQQFGHTDLPVVFGKAWDYLPRVWYSTDSARFYYLLDWPSAIAPGPERITTEYKLMAAIARNYPDFGHIVDIDEFLREHDEFLVHDSGRTWVKKRLTTEDYFTTTLGQHQDDYEQWRMMLVQKKI